MENFAIFGKKLLVYWTECPLLQNFFVYYFHFSPYRLITPGLGSDRWWLTGGMAQIVLSCNPFMI